MIIRILQSNLYNGKDRKNKQIIILFGGIYFVINEIKMYEYPMLLIMSSVFFLLQTSFKMLSFVNILLCVFFKF